METDTELYRRWLNDRARSLRSQDRPPVLPPDVERRRRRFRRRLLAAERHAFPARCEDRPPVPARVLGEIARPGFRVQRLGLETRPGCEATCTLYLPDSGDRPAAAVLCVHGHWSGARRDPVVQSRCVGLARLGFVVLTLDAWGAGERGTTAGQNEYHGGLLGASLWPVGTPLHGLQLWDNIRAIDYLQSRPDVRPDRIGCTGASGGGNQTTILTSFDDRVACAVPVCSVGTFESYQTAACCVDELLPGALTFAEEGDLLGIAAPRALMVISASRDSFHFGPVAASEALDRTRAYYAALGAEERLRHVVFESGHDYSRPMREAMYGWMARWLQGRGDGSPIPEPELTLEAPDALRCYPGFRPGRVITTDRWVRQRFEERAAAVAWPRNVEEWRGMRRERVARLAKLLRVSRARPHGRLVGEEGRWTLETDEGVRLPLERLGGSRPRAALLLHPGGRRIEAVETAALRAGSRQLTTFAPDFRGCGELTLTGQNLGEIPDHNLVEWCEWVGRPLLGQWVQDIRRLARAVAEAGAPRPIVWAWREAGLAAILAAALDPGTFGIIRVREMFPTYGVSGRPHGARMLAFLPGIMELGDVPHLAALAAPAELSFAEPIGLDGAPVGEAEMERLFAPLRELYRLLGAEDRLQAYVAAPPEPG